MIPLSDNNPTTHPPIVTVAIIILNFAALLWLINLPPVQRERAVIEHGFIPRRIAQLADRKPITVSIEHQRIVRGKLLAQKIEYKLDPEPSQIYASLLSAMFLHGGWLHLIGNMWFLWLFGNNVEDRLGHFVFLGFYLIGGLLATGCHWAYDPMSTLPVIGASGAVAAVLGAYAVTFPTARVRTLVFLVIIVTIVELPALLVLGFWFVTQLIEAAGVMRLGVNGGDMGVAFWAHIGGFVSGMIFMPLLSAGAPPPGSNWHEEAERQFS